MSKAENQLDSKLNVKKFPTNSPKYYSLDNSQDWVRALQLELSEKVLDDKSPEDILSQTELRIELEIEKKYKPHYGEYILTKGSVKTKYLTLCVRTLVEMYDELDLEFKACFLPNHLESEEQFQDQTEIFENEDMYELYFYNKGIADLKEMIHEQIYLNINEYPISDEDTPLPDSGTQH